VTDPWVAYLHKSQGQAAHPVVQAAAQLDQTNLKQAVDAGCGVGNETAALLAMEYRVAAFDASAEAVKLCRQRFAAKAKVSLDQARFHDFDYPPAGLLMAFSSLFFCTHEEFDLAWRKISAAIQPGGVFVGHFMGPDDDWARGYRFATCPLSETEVRALFAGYEMHSFEQRNAPGPTRMGKTKHWHNFSVLARKPL